MTDPVVFVKEKIENIWKLFGGYPGRWRTAPGRDLGNDERAFAPGPAYLRGRV